MPLRLFFFGLVVFGSPLLAKGLLINGTYRGYNPIDPVQPIELTVKANPQTAETAITHCSFNFYCVTESEAALISPIVDSDIYAPNGEKIWKVRFEYRSGNRVIPVFKIVAKDPEARSGFVLLLGGSEVQVAMKKVAD